MSEPSNTNSSPTRVDAANDRRRKKSEISAILQDLERLKTIPADKKKRCIWELLQNAKDEAISGEAKKKRKGVTGKNCLNSLCGSNSAIGNDKLIICFVYAGR